MADLNLETSSVVYKVFRSIANPNVESYGKAIERETGLTQGQVGDSLRKLLEEKIIEKGKRTRSQYYEIDYTGLEQWLKQYWSVEKTFEDFPRFLEGYVESYVSSKEKSTFEKMFGEHFVEGLIAFHEDKDGKLTDKQEKLMDKISQGDETLTPGDIMYEAFHRYRL